MPTAHTGSGIAARLERTDERFRETVELLTKAGDPEESIRAFIARQAGLQTPLGRMATAFAEGFYASRIDRTSARFIGRMARASSQTQGDEARRIIDGYDRVAAWLSRGLLKGSAELRLNTRVERVRWAPHKVEVQARTPWGTCFPCSTGAGF
jgi:hypothetical protein